MKRPQRQFETVPITEVLKKAIDIDDDKMVAKEDGEKNPAPGAPIPFRERFVGTRQGGSYECTRG